jgi:elongation factor Ts
MSDGSQRVSASDVQALRRATGAGMLDAKRALERTGGDFDAAVQVLREEGKAASLRRKEREAGEGAVALAIDEGAGAGAIVELRCETDFVAKSEPFVHLAEELATLAASKGVEALEGRKPDVEALAASLKERVEVGRVERLEAAAGSVLDGYLHVQHGRGVNAVLVELAGGTRELAHDVALHIAFARPTYLRREDVPAEEVDKERATLEAQTRREGKPEAAIEKIVEGRLAGFFKERCLLDQPYVRDERRSVAELLGPARVVRFAQVVVKD